MAIIYQINGLRKAGPRNPLYCKCLRFWARAVHRAPQWLLRIPLRSLMIRPCIPCILDQPVAQPDEQGRARDQRVDQSFELLQNHPLDSPVRSALICRSIGGSRHPSRVQINGHCLAHCCAWCMESMDPLFALQRPLRCPFIRPRTLNRAAEYLIYTAHRLRICSAGGGASARPSAWCKY